MFCACSFHGNSMNNLLSYCGLIDAKIRASGRDLPVPKDLTIPFDFEDRILLASHVLNQALNSLDDPYK